MFKFKVSDEKCKSSCQKIKDKDRNQYIICMTKCAQKMKEDCFSIYNKFYDQVIGKVPEYKTIRK